jgi:two-component system OmpR family response regulator
VLAGDAIFERRSPAATDHGIGLAMALDLAGAEGGTLRLAASTGSSTSFGLLLPGGRGVPPCQGPGPFPAPARPGTGSFVTHGLSRGETPMTTGSRILVVDDEPSITDAVATALRYEGFDVREASTGRSALDAAVDFRPDLIVLDVLLPDLDGVAITARLRRDAQPVAVLLLTARDATEDKVAGLTAGADDYLTKPFNLGELIARIHAILRRVGPPADDGSILRFADLLMDQQTHEVWRGTSPVHLTATEFALLRYFLLNPRRVLSKAQIIEHVWLDNPDRDDTIVETFISYLRRKLDRSGPPLIHTIRRVGYTLRRPDDQP